MRTHRNASNRAGIHRADTWSISTLYPCEKVSAFRTTVNNGLVSKRDGFHGSFQILNRPEIRQKSLFPVEREKVVRWKIYRPRKFKLKLHPYTIRDGCIYADFIGGRVSELNSAAARVKSPKSRDTTGVEMTLLLVCKLREDSYCASANFYNFSLIS